MDRVSIESSRRGVARQLLEGRSAEAALVAVPLVFSICARAQACAARLAQRAAKEGGGARPAGSGETVAVQVEAAREMARGLLVNLASSPPGKQTLILLRELASPALDVRRAGARLRLLLERHVLGIPPEELRDIAQLAGLERWLASVSTPSAALLAGLLEGEDPPLCGLPGLDPRGDEAALRALAAAMIDDDGFELRPHVAGEPRETGSLPRQARHPLVEKLRATGRPATALRTLCRMIELAEIALALEGAAPPAARAWAGALPICAGTGLGWVETARGLLLHRVEIDGDRVASCRILAPTEWNFHPAGVLARELGALRAPSAAGLRAAAERAVVALDPCVGYQVEVES